MTSSHAHQHMARTVVRGLVALLFAALLVAGSCSLAFADGDPASDYLLDQQVFTLTQATSSPAQAQLSATVQTANRSGFAIRVAVISSSYDLGSVAALWLKPQTYARFLGIELSLAYKGRLLVVMPDGFGFNWPGHSTAAAYRMLAGVRVTRGEVGTVAAALAAVHGLAAASGVRLPAAGVSSINAAASPSHGQGGNDAHSSAGASSAGVVLLIAAGAMLALALILTLLIRRQDGRVAGGVRVLPRAVVLLTIAVGVPILVLGVLRHASPRKVLDAKPLNEATPFTWAEGQRPAPNFELTDQNGQRISPASFHGRPVIVTFIDPLCRNLCPLEGRVLDEVDQRLPVQERPQIIAVSVDVYADTHADLMQDFSRWGLVPQWHWAIGSVSELAGVWRRYYAEVQVSTKRIAGTTVHYITHSEMAYLIDANGYERALFSWPFNAKDVEKTVRELERA
jgi:cytochrome oxidase Cu insertion factor (SCO1/SenC/PrrC family)